MKNKLTLCLVALSLFSFQNLTAAKYIIKTDTFKSSIYELKDENIENVTTDPWGNWYNSGSISCTGYIPTINGQTADFQQNDTCSQPQTRERNVYNIYNNGLKQFSHIEYGYQNVDNVTSRNITVTAGSLVYTGKFSNCSEWSPSVDTVNSGTQFQQSQTCKEETQQSIDYYLLADLIDSEIVIGEIDSNNTQNATGTKTGVWTLTHSSGYIEGWRKTSYSDGRPTETDQLYNPILSSSLVGQTCSDYSRDYYRYGSCGGWSFRGNIPGVLHQEKRDCIIYTYKCQ